MKHHAHVAHHVKGRIRLRIPKAKGDHAALEKVKRSIAPIHGVTSVETNSATGSVVVQYDSARHADFPSVLARHAEANSLFTLAPPHVSEVDEMVGAIEKEAEFLAEHSDVARTVVDFCKRANQEVKKATNNALDLQVLLPLGLAVYAFLELEADIATPLWLTLGIFSFNSFISLHHPLPATMDVAAPEPATEPARPRRAARARSRSSQ